MSKRAPVSVVGDSSPTGAVEAVESAIADIAAGKMVILVDDEDRENEGDLFMAAEKVTPEAINFMARYGRGLICLTLTEERIRELDLPMMVDSNTSRFQTGFTVSIEAREGVSTGISARDRAHTILTAVRPGVMPEELVRPGHIFPIRARPGGVLVRTGQTEGSVDMARLAGLAPAGVICEIMNEDGSMARRPELEEFAKTHDLRIVTIADLIEYRLAHESLVTKVAERELVSPEWGRFRAVVMRSVVDDREHLCLIKGEIDPNEAILARVQSLELPSDIIGLALSGGGAEMRAAMKLITEEGAGIFVYLIHEDQPGARLSDKLVRESDRNNDSKVQRVGRRLALREFGIGAQILKAAGVRKFRLMSNTDIRIVGIEGYDLELVERVPLPMDEVEDAGGAS